MNYDFSNLGAEQFENMVRSLNEKKFGIACEQYGRGPDGQREFVYEGEFADGDGTLVSGRVIGQVKYKYSTTKTDDYAWLTREIDRELAGFQEKEEAYRPDYYLFYTNIVLTAVKDRGLRDKVCAYVEKKNKIIPHFILLGYDEICAMLDNNRDVATAYGLVLPGDVLSQLLPEEGTDPAQWLKKYLYSEFREELYTRMEQAGSATEQKISLEKVCVDLNVLDRESGNTFKIAEHIFQLGGGRLGYQKKGHREEPDREENMVLIGGPGKGKSTICQFMAQVYRARTLQKMGCRERMLDEFAGGPGENGKDLPGRVRLPFEVVLRDYAAWISRREETEDISVLQYMRERIRRIAGENVPARVLRELLRNIPWIFFFDGLDEVPESSNRREVLRAIHLFIAMELRELACDYMVIATTRAQGYNHEFDEERYRHLEVTEFSEEDCCRYIEKLFAVMEEQSVRREEYVRIMKEALSDSITGRLMKTPLQVTIIAILVKRGGKPPHDRYSLFREYYETVVSREKQKEIVEMLNENTDWLEELHYLTGLGLQCGSQQQENAAAEISLEELRSVIRTYVEENRDDFYEDKADCERKAEEFLRTMTQRICFLCENRSGFYSFQIRSVQEFFAGTCLVKGKSDGEVMENIRRIAYSAYWRNVLLFALGYMERERKSLEPWVGALCEQMNGKENFLQEDYTPENLCLFGSWLALDILTEDLFRGKQQEKYIVLASGAAAFAGHADYQKFSLLTGVRRDRLLRYLQQNACRDAALQESSLNVYLKMHENEKNNLEEEIIQLCGQLPPERRTAACVLILENLVGDGGRLAEYAGSKLETALEQGEVRQLLPCRILGFLLYRKGRERSAELKKNLFLQCLYCEDWSVSAAWKWQALGVQCDIALLRGYLTPWGRGTLSQNMILNLTDSFEIMVKDQVLRRETLTEIQAEVQKLNAGFLAEFCAFLLEPSLEKYRELCSLADSGEDYLTGKYRALVRYYAPYDQVETEEAFQAAWRRREEDLGRFVRREFGELYFRETDVRFYSSVGCRSDAFDELTEQGIISVERIEELSDGFLQQFLFAAGVQLECVRQIADISESTAEYFGRMVAEASRRNLYAYHMTDILAVLMSPKFRKRFWEQCPDFDPVERIAEEELRERKWRRHRVPCISAEEAETIIGNIIHKVIYEAEESSYLALIPWLIDDKTDLKRCISGNDLKQLCQTDCRSESNRLTVKLLRMCLEENREPGRVVEEILQTGVPRAVIFTELENMLHFCEAENKEKLWVRTYLELMDETFAGSGELRGRILGDMAELRSASSMPDYFMYALSTRSTT